ncbi:MAG: thioredoxin domain-containing protein [Bacteroidota bacterium]
MQNFCISVLFIIISHYALAQSEKAKGNQLLNESSPYLLQHAYNPVNWYPWGEIALEKAKKEDKLLIISIGYAACHWCHVMEEESFQDTATARFMNEHFVAIKVDREERPDIDKIYMDAFRLISESTGWPLNAIALPNGKPIYAVSYLPKDQWLKTLDIFSKGYRDKREQIEKQAEMLTEGIQKFAFTTEKPPVQKFEMDMLNKMFTNMQQYFDTNYGGFKGAPKFPRPTAFHYLLEYYHATKDIAILETVENTLDHIALGGIYDHLGGGFARYTVDEAWKVPHFEKMLYDNAMLVSLYADAYRLTKKELYRQVIKESLAFVQRELTDGSGLFYSAVSADSEGEEGRFYVWQQSEIEKLLQEESKAFCDYYHIEKKGNWEEGKNILQLSPDNYQTEVTVSLQPVREKLFKERENREKPEVDNKLLTSWNSLMIHAFSNAYRALGNTAYLEIAENNASLLMQHFQQDEGLLRNYKQGKKIPAFLDDYAYLAKALIALYQVTFNEKYLNWAMTITTYTLEHFQDENSGLFFYTEKNKQGLVSQKMELADNVLPASNAVMCKNLQLLGWYYERKDFHEITEKMISHIIPALLKDGNFYASWASSLLWLVKEPYEVAIVGENYQKIRRNWDKEYLPNILIFGGDKEGDLSFMQYKLIEGETNIYVCHRKICQRPVQEIALAKKLLK